MLPANRKNVKEYVLDFDALLRAQDDLATRRHNKVGEDMLDLQKRIEALEREHTLNMEALSEYFTAKMTQERQASKRIEKAATQLTPGGSG